MIVRADPYLPLHSCWWCDAPISPHADRWGQLVQPVQLVGCPPSHVLRYNCWIGVQHTPIPRLEQDWRGLRWYHERDAAELPEEAGPTPPPLTRPRRLPLPLAPPSCAVTAGKALQCVGRWWLQLCAHSGINWSRYSRREPARHSPLGAGYA